LPKGKQGRALLLCFYSSIYATTPPESNGMAEALVNTIKRDYVYTNDCETAEKVLKMLPDWFHDYNNIAPHSALGMISPVEYKLTKTR
jgi:putative transposase